MKARLVPAHRIYVPCLIFAIRTGEIITTKKSETELVFAGEGEIGRDLNSDRYLLQSQKKPVAIAIDLPRVCSGVSSTGNKNGIPSNPMARNVLKTVQFQHVS